MKTKKGTKSITTKEQIEQEALNIYPENEESKKCDEETNTIYTIADWSELFYYGKSNIIKNRFLEIISKSEFVQFFEALDYEYGINGKNKSVKTAFEIYKEKANNSTDVLSMYKMFHIYKNEYSKFGMKKRNKILEKFYLFKSFAHLSRQEYQGYTLPFNRFHILIDFKLYLKHEDPVLLKFNQFISHLMKYYDYYQIKLDDVILIKSFIYFVMLNEKEASKLLLEPLIVKGNLQAVYQLALLLDDKDKTKKLYEYLEHSNYYRCYCDYALFLFKNLNDTQKALKILKIAISHGIIRANYLYYDIFLNSLDLSKREDNKNFEKEILFLFNLLIDNICLDEAFSYFEFFYLRKLCNKHFNLKDLADKNFFEYEKGFIDILIKNSSPSFSKEDIEKNKEFITRLYMRSDYFCEFNLACGFIYYLGIENIIKKDLKKSLFKFQISFDNSQSKSYKRFCYSYIVKIKDKLFRLKDKDITKEDLDTSKNKLFELYSSSIDLESIANLSSSFFYYLFVLYSKKWGNQGDGLMEYICIKRASENKIKKPGTGTIISYYRRYKSKKLIFNDKEILQKLKESTKKTDHEGYGEDGSICPICFINQRNVLFYPCKHRFCDFCANKIMENCKCPICRGLILIKLDFDKLEK